jgi:hypothetical protein
MRGIVLPFGGVVSENQSLLFQPRQDHSELRLLAAGERTSDGSSGRCERAQQPNVHPFRKGREASQQVPFALGKLFRVRAQHAGQARCCLVERFGLVEFEVGRVRRIAVPVSSQIRAEHGDR